MNKEDSLYIKKRFGNKILSILKRLVGGSSADAPLVVQCVYESDWEVNHTAQEVIQAIENGRPVQYFVKDSNGWGSGIILNTTVDRIELLVIRDYLDETFFVEKYAHIDGRIDHQ